MCLDCIRLSTPSVVTSSDARRWDIEIFREDGEKELVEEKDEECWMKGETAEDEETEEDGEGGGGEGTGGEKGGRSVGGSTSEFCSCVRSIGLLSLFPVSASWTANRRI
jgi:hypothetical protein